MLTLRKYNYKHWVEKLKERKHQSLQPLTIEVQRPDRPLTTSLVVFVISGPCRNLGRVEPRPQALFTFLTLLCDHISWRRSAEAAILATSHNWSAQTKPASHDKSCRFCDFWAICKVCFLIKAHFEIFQHNFAPLQRILLWIMRLDPNKSKSWTMKSLQKNTYHKEIVISPQLHMVIGKLPMGWFWEEKSTNKPTGILPMTIWQRKLQKLFWFTGR